MPTEAADARLLDASGASVRVASLWGRGPCLLVLLRHFGCIGCAEQMLDLAPRLQELARIGVRTVLVGNGSLEHRAGFVERNALEGAPVEVLVDPSLELYRALHLVRSAWATVGPRAIRDAARAFAGGLPHGHVEGDRTQQGGVLFVDAQGVVRLYRRSRSIGDHPPASDLVEVALKSALEGKSVTTLV